MIYFDCIFDKKKCKIDRCDLLDLQLILCDIKMKSKVLKYVKKIIQSI